MKVAVVLACLLVAVAAKPQFRGSHLGGLGGFGGGFGGNAGGNAQSGSIQAQSTGPFGGTSQIQKSSSSAGGFASGPGSASFNSAGSTVGQSTGLFGSDQFANNRATSNQFGR
ncbi:hypothetical protein FJT64_002364 [Amphibalanus amphitrite]|uniref:Uncharacterized protein n=1 Tax=Amphibalanus amphitrite TaxID=1232801 RepID=A0A6A4WSH4_AMPAM|nr:glycine-rich RNA-binding protein 3, mitochondrial-like [Amphibalanus amphitrite]KAF0306744.1 hypothetical protein FJT64_002364 [Amphibalanus amphitrite]